MSDTQVVPPAVLKQALPPFPAQLPTAQRGVLELVINEDGVVESATMRESVNPRYDPQLLSAAKSWQYKPATLDGVPVKYRKMMQVDVKR
jgi:TonB family protein